MEPWHWAIRDDFKNHTRRKTLNGCIHCSLNGTSHERANEHSCNLPVTPSIIVTSHTLTANAVNTFWLLDILRLDILGGSQHSYIRTPALLDVCMCLHPVYHADNICFDIFHTVKQHVERYTLTPTVDWHTHWSGVIPDTLGWPNPSLGCCHRYPSVHRNIHEEAIVGVSGFKFVLYDIKLFWSIDIVVSTPPTLTQL